MVELSKVNPFDVTWNRILWNVIFSPESSIIKGTGSILISRWLQMKVKWIFLWFFLFCFSRNPGCLSVWRRSLPRPRRSWQGKNRLRYDVPPTAGRVPDPVSPNSSLFVLSVNSWTALNLRKGISCTRENYQKYFILIQIFNPDFHLVYFSSYLEQLQILSNKYACMKGLWLIVFCVIFGLMYGFLQVAGKFAIFKTLALLPCLC